MTTDTMGIVAGGGDPPHPPVARRSSGRSHLLMRHLLFLLVGPTDTSFSPVGLGRVHRLRNELSAVALVDACLTVRIDLSFVVVVDVRTCRHAIIGGVVSTSELVVELKLCRGMLPLLAYTWIDR